MNNFFTLIQEGNRIGNRFWILVVRSFLLSQHEMQNLRMRIGNVKAAKIIDLRNFISLYFSVGVIFTLSLCKARNRFTQLNFVKYIRVKARKLQYSETALNFSFTCSIKLKKGCKDTSIRQRKDCKSTIKNRLYTQRNVFFNVHGKDEYYLTAAKNYRCSFRTNPKMNTICMAIFFLVAFITLNQWLWLFFLLNFGLHFGIPRTTN